jgi:hypothetical protein
MKKCAEGIFSFFVCHFVHLMIINFIYYVMLSYFVLKCASFWRSGLGLAWVHHGCNESEMLLNAHHVVIALVGIIPFDMDRIMSDLKDPLKISHNDLIQTQAHDRSSYKAPVREQIVDDIFMSSVNLLL